MRQFAFIAAGGLICAAVPALAQTAVAPQNVKPEDVAMSPLSDLNVRKKDVPPALEMAMAKPYDLQGIKSCKGLTTAIMDLDVVLGDDIDVATGEKSDEERIGNSAGAIAKSVIGGFVPFRGVIRELSGANAQQRLWERALYAGAARRAFLKGMGEQRGCAWPARSATPEIVARLAAEREEMKLAKNDAKEDAKDAKAKAKDEKTSGEPVAVSFESKEVVQPTGGKR
jgi:hypothetical protein